MFFLFLCRFPICRLGSGVVMIESIPDLCLHFSRSTNSLRFMQELEVNNLVKYTKYKAWAVLHRFYILHISCNFDSEKYFFRTL